MLDKAASFITWDRLGFTASSLCAVHCISLPFLIMAMPFIAGTWIADRELELWFAGGSVCLALGCSIMTSLRYKKYWLIGLVLFGGALLMGTHASAPPICCSEDLSWPHFMGTATGGGLLAASHFLNLGLIKCNSKNTDCGCPDSGCI